MNTLIKSRFYRIALATVPGMLFRVQHWRMHRRFGNHAYLASLRHPCTFNEKLLRSKLFKQHADLTHLVDKAAVKQWVSERIGNQHIIPTIGVYTDPDAVPLDALPRPCVVKPTHASGHVLIFRGNTKDPTPEVSRQRMRLWQRINHYYVSGESQYRHVQPRVICEPLLGGCKEDLPDFKFFCFDGEPEFVQVDLDRHSRHVRRYYDCQWQPQGFTLRYPMATREVPRPASLDQMLNIARKLSKGFSFVRVDLYDVDAHIYFGELTFHPESGIAPFSDYQTDLELGRRLKQ